MTEGPWSASQGFPIGEKRYAPSVPRNRNAIAEVLQAELPTSGMVLEVASGSGEHVLYFAELFPHLTWQPSDPDPAALASIAAWRADAGCDNVLAPLALDAASEAWPVEAANAVLCINMVHISPWEATLGVFAAAQHLLPQGSPLIFYGPYTQASVDTALSNLTFDARLRERNRKWGLRSVESMDDAGLSLGFVRTAKYEMPANNLMLIYRANRVG
jgi:Protein of unknown function (DUF938)